MRDGTVGQDTHCAFGHLTLQEATPRPGSHPRHYRTTFICKNEGQALIGLVDHPAGAAQTDAMSQQDRGAGVSRGGGTSGPGTPEFREENRGRGRIGSRVSPLPGPVDPEVKEENEGRVGSRMSPPHGPRETGRYELIGAREIMSGVDSSAAVRGKAWDTAIGASRLFI